MRVSYGLREGDELFVRKFEDAAELHIIKRASEDGAQPFRCAEQIDVLADEGGIYGRIETALHGGNIHAFAMGNINQVQRRNPVLPKNRRGGRQSARLRQTLGGRYSRPITGHLHHQKGHDQHTGSDNILWSRSDEGYRTLVL